MMRKIFVGLLMIASTLVEAAEITGQQAMQLMDEGKAKEAIAAFEKLAAEGDTKAMVQLGLFYYEGTGVEHDYEKAMDWWLMGMSNQNADAFTNLGVLHRDGLGVPKNRKIAYCVFLTTHMCGLGSQSTVMRANSCLRRLLAEMPKEELKDVLSNYTLSYMEAYINARGKLSGIPAEHQPSKENPALKDLPWWLEGELDGIFGEPSTEELAARKKKEEERAKAYEASKHMLTYQIKFPNDDIKYDSNTFITGMGMGSGAIKKENLKKVNDGFVFEDSSHITVSPRRFVAIENRKDRTCLVYEIKHPAKSEPADWSQWNRADFALKDRMDLFSLIGGNEPKSKTDRLPADAPLMRFKVEK